MTCKDCISCSRCKDLYEAFGMFIDIENSSICKHFKNIADYAEVKHGEWVEGKSLEKCSLCGKKGFSDWIYCPRCGAKMDDKKNDFKE